MTVLLFTFKYDFYLLISIFGTWLFWVRWFCPECNAVADCYLAALGSPSPGIRLLGLLSPERRELNELQERHSAREAHWGRLPLAGGSESSPPSFRLHLMAHIDSMELGAMLFLLVKSCAGEVGK